jgi:Secretion system C-terminal sorting domain
MKIKQFILPILFLTATIQESAARKIYVNNKQTVAGEGSLSLPYQSIQEAVNGSASGDTIVLRKGIYREQVIVKKSGLSFLPYQNEEVIMSGTEPLLSWELVTGSIYKTIMNWNVTDGGQSNQVFLDGQMIYEARWPKMKGNDMTYMPDNAKAKEVRQNILLGNLNYRDFYFDAFSETAGRWDGAQVWVNLSHNGNDGQGWTGTVVKTDPVKHLITIDGRGLKIEELPWGLGKNTEFYLFSPKASAVFSSGGVAGILGKGEWWKNADTLYVNMPNGLPPADDATKFNLIEAKKRIYAFSPEPLILTMAGTRVSGLNLFATSITTDINAAGRSNPAANAKDNVFENLDVKYVTHFTDQRGDYQSQWDAKSGLIISGVRNVVRNCTLQYSSGAAISVLGNQNKIWNNVIHDVNYSVSESGAINTGNSSAECLDLEIAYNTIYNTPQQVIDCAHLKNSNPLVYGLARIHHNEVHDFMLRAYDSGAIETGFQNFGWLRIDHNIFYNATHFLAIGIYADYGGNQFMDHNLFWNIERPIQINGNLSVGFKPNRVYNNTSFSEGLSKPGIQNGVNTWGPLFDVRNNIMSGSIPAGPSGSIVRSNLSVSSSAAQSELFYNYPANDYSLKSSAVKAIDKGEYLPYAYPINGIPDLGCFESGLDPWQAGAGNFKPEFVLTDTVQTIVVKSNQAKTTKFPIYALAYCGFKGDIALSLENMPSGITGTLSSNTVPANGSVELSLQSNNVLKSVQTFILKGVSGNLIYERTYPIITSDIPSGITIQEQRITGIYPNPASDRINIAIYSEQRQEIILQIYNCFSRLCISKQENLEPGENEKITDIEGLAAGLYLVRISSLNGKSLGTYKFIKH